MIFPQLVLKLLERRSLIWLFFIHDHFQVSVIGVCEIIPRQLPRSDFPNTKFDGEAALLNRYVSVVLSEFSWNPSGQYSLYSSYRGAILRGFRML